MDGTADGDDGVGVDGRTLRSSMVGVAADDNVRELKCWC